MSVKKTKPKKRKKNPGGRPKGTGKPIAKNEHVLKEEYLETIERMGTYGMDLQDVAYLINVPQSTFREMRKKYPQINQRYLKGKASGISRVKMTAYALAETGKCPTTMRWWVEREEIKLDQLAEGKNANKTSGKVTRDRLLEAIKKDPFMDIEQPDLDGPEPEEKDVTPKKVNDPFME